VEEINRHRFFSSSFIIDMLLNGSAKGAIVDVLGEVGFQALKAVSDTFTLKLSISLCRWIYRYVYEQPPSIDAISHYGWIALGLQLLEARSFVNATIEMIIGDGPTILAVGKFLADGMIILTYMSSLAACYNAAAILCWFWGSVAKPCSPAIGIGIPLYVAYLAVPHSWQRRVQTLLEKFIIILNICAYVALLGLSLTMSLAGRLWIKYQDLLEFLGRLVKRQSRRRGEPLYVYESLIGPQEIRLIKLRRGLGGMIICEFEHVSLEDAPVYDAISYTWDNPSLSHGVLIDGHWLPLSAKVYDILQDRASFWRTKTLWIDFICINQADLQEKSSQVRLMTDIFRRAVRVVAWLGNSPETRMALQLLEQLHANLSWGQLEQGKHQRLLLNQARDPRFPALVNLLRLPFWSRVWIVQEIAVAQTVHIVCCGRCIEWDVLSEPIRAFAHPELRHLVKDEDLKFVGKFPTGIGPVRFISDLRVKKLIGLPIPLLDIAGEMFGYNATNPRDMVFALVGMSSGAGDQTLIPDYEKSVEEVYLDASKYFLDQDEPVLTLHSAGIGHHRNLSLPSWATDWSSIPHVTPLRKKAYFALYTASGDSKARMSINLDLNILTLDGILFDEVIKATSSYLSMPANYDDVTTASYKEWIYNCHEEARAVAAGTSDTYLNGQSRSDAFWRTLIGDFVDGIYPAPAKYSESYWAHERVLSMTRRLYPHLQGLKVPEAKEFFSDGSPQTTPQKHNPDAVESISGSTDTFQTDRASSENFSFAEGSCSFGRRFAVTKKGYMAMIPPHSEVGDLICILLGGQTPFILRYDPDNGDSDNTMGNRGTYQLVGEAYVHGLMGGEAMKELAAGQVHLQEFKIR
jgi:hypothetical protein